MILLKSIAEHKFNRIQGKKPKKFDDIGWIFSFLVLTNNELKIEYKKALENGFIQEKLSLGSIRCVSLTKSGYKQYKGN